MKVNKSLITTGNRKKKNLRKKFVCCLMKGRGACVILLIKESIDAWLPDAGKYPFPPYYAII